MVNSLTIFENNSASSVVFICLTSSDKVVALVVFAGLSIMV
jgi:hypothetical protein